MSSSISFEGQLAQKQTRYPWYLLSPEYIAAKELSHEWAASYDTKVTGLFMFSQEHSLTGRPFQDWDRLREVLAPTLIVWKPPPRSREPLQVVC